MTDRLIRETEPNTGEFASPVPQYWNQSLNNGQGGNEKVRGENGATKSHVQGTVSPVDLKRKLIGRATYQPEALFQTLTLATGENNATALAYDRENALFVGLNTTPAQVVKVDVATLQRVGGLTLPAGANETRVASLIAISPGIVLHASYTNPWVITKIDGRTMTVTSQLTGISEAVNDKFARPVTFDGEFVYIGCDSATGKVVKLNPFTTPMTRVGSVTFGAGINNVIAMVYLNGYLYAGCETAPAYIVKINPRDMSVVSSMQLSVGSDNARAITTDGRYLYIGTYTTPLRVVKFDPETMTEVATYTANAGENQCYSMTTDGRYVYIGTWADPAALIQVDPVTMTRVSAMALNPGFPSDLMFMDPYLITTADTTPGRVVRFVHPRLLTSTDVNQGAPALDANAWPVRVTGRNSQVGGDLAAIWANSAPVNTPQHLDVALPASLQANGQYVVLVRNPSVVTSLVVQAKLTANTFDGATRYPILTTWSVAPGMEIATVVEGWLVGNGARLTLRNATVLGAADGFTATVRVIEV